MIAGWQKEPSSTGRCTRICMFSMFFFGNFDFFGWLRQPAGRMVQASSMAGAVHILYIFKTETRVMSGSRWFGNIFGKIGSSLMRWISNIRIGLLVLYIGVATSLVRLGPAMRWISNIRVGLLVLYIVYVHFLARIAMYIASFDLQMLVF